MVRSKTDMKKHTNSSSGRAVERLTRVEVRLDSIDQTTREGFQGLGAQLQGMQECVHQIDAKMDASLHGVNDQPGIVVRLDRLEQAHERARWLTRAIAGTVITLVVGALWALIKG